jgi:hypothetical protein
VLEVLVGQALDDLEGGRLEPASALRLMAQIAWDLGTRCGRVAIALNRAPWLITTVLHCATRSASGRVRRIEDLTDEHALAARIARAYVANIAVEAGLSTLTTTGRGYPEPMFPAHVCPDSSSRSSALRRSVGDRGATITRAATGARPTAQTWLIQRERERREP